MTDTATQGPQTLDQLDAYFQTRREQVPVLRQRADAEGIEAIRSSEDVVPLLFPHTTYKSYPDSLLANGRFAAMNKWLDSLSTYRVDVDVEGVTTVDEWIARLHADGHLIHSSSGTSGKGSFLNKSRADRNANLDNLIDSFRWIGMEPSPEWHVMPTGPDTGMASNRETQDRVIESFGRPDRVHIPRGELNTQHYSYMTRLASMRRKMADGSATPDEIAAFEAEGAERQTRTEDYVQYVAEQVSARRDERFLFTSMFPLLYRLTEVLADQGLKPGDITGDNALMSGGGLKGIALPPDYKERSFSMLNIDPAKFLHYYSMQEINVRMVKCMEGRYHVPQGLALFVLDKEGEQLAPVSDGMVEGRAAFVDTSVDGRWGGTMSGDKIIADLGTCPCGRPGPTVLDDITRYSDLPDGDKITCAGTMDAYVRGFIDA